MEMVVGALMDVKDAGKVRNRRVTKSRIFCVINNVGRALLLGLHENKMAAPLDILRFYRLYLR